MITKSQLMPNCRQLHYLMHTAKEHSVSVTEEPGKDLHHTIHKARSSFVLHRPLCFCPEFFFFFVSPSCFSSFARALFPTQFVAAETCEGLGTESGRPQRPEPSRGRGLPSGRPGREREREEGRAGEARACRRLRPHNSSQAIPLYTAQSYKLAGSCWP